MGRTLENNQEEVNCTHKGTSWIATLCRVNHHHKSGQYQEERESIAVVHAQSTVQKNIYLAKKDPFNFCYIDIVLCVICVILC